MLQACGAWLATIDAVALAASFVALALLEVFRPRREHRHGQAERWTTNLGLQTLNTIVLSFLPLGAVTIAAQLWAPHWRPAEFAVSVVGSLPVLVAGLLLLDLNSYALHRLEHAVQPLWRLHAVHHSDVEIDASTGFRHHPIEYLVSLSIGVAVIVLLGLPPWVVSFYATFALVAGLAQHANVALPARIDAGLRRLLVTPAMHEVHHSVDARDYDSNFGTLFSFWDRLFGTYRGATVLGSELVRFGVEPFTGPRYAAPHWGLLLPLHVRRNKKDPMPTAP